MVYKSFSEFENKRTYKISASAYRRIFAFIFDLMILNLLTLPIQLAIIGMIPQNGNFMTEISAASAALQSSKALYLAIILCSLIAFAYFVLMEYCFGHTIGKKILGLEVISLKGDLTLTQCLTRNLFTIIVFPITLLWLIEPIFMIFNKKRQRLTEVLSNTMVIESVTVSLR